jgi:methyl-accepting chemotaxis protein
MWLFDSSTKEIEKLAEKNGKSVEDIQYCIERINYIRTSSRHAEEKTNRIMEVVNYLVEQVAGNNIANDKFNFMKFNAVEKSGLPLTIEELL